MEDLRQFVCYLWGSLCTTKNFTRDEFVSADILAVCRTPVTHELSQMTLLSMSSHSSVEMPSRYSGSHGFDILLGIQIFYFVTSSRQVDQFTFHIFYLFLFLRYLLV